MSKKRFIDTSFWSDVWVVDSLTREERYFFMYLLTNDKTSIAGVYELSLKMMAFESDFTREEIATMFNKMRAKVCYVDGWVVMRNGIKNQNYKNEKIRRGIEIVLGQCPVECLSFLDIPNDFMVVLPKRPQQQGLLDDSYMTLDESSHSDTEFDTDSNSELDASSQDLGKPKKIAKVADPKSYAMAVRRDEALEKKEAMARERTPDEIKTSRDVVDNIRKNLMDKGIVKRKATT